MPTNLNLYCEICWNQRESMICVFPGHSTFIERDYTDTREYCTECHSRIVNNGMCSSGCGMDGNFPRPKGSVKKKAFAVTEKFLSEIIK